MTKFVVELEGQHRAEVTVEADNEDEAIMLAQEIADDGEADSYNDEFYTAIGSPKEVEE